jgi:hypothetical protein
MGRLRPDVVVTFDISVPEITWCFIAGNPSMSVSIFYRCGTAGADCRGSRFDKVSDNSLIDITIAPTA